SHPGEAEWGTSCTARITGIPASIGAQFLAAGYVTHPGVLSPDAAFEPLDFFAELQRRKIVVEEEIVHTQILAAILDEAPQGAPALP
ncbi:MAG: hypothetical protein KGR26_07840, partial [Cyanobacteria bacterium REEB65]|nr:hypothetical protein [Cyanobacteria bacterium REEB65]